MRLMATFKVRKPDGLHCFNCNASVDADASRCPKCGREFDASPASAPAQGASERVKRVFESRRRGSRMMVIVALAAVGILAVLLVPRRSKGVTVERPAGARPDYRLVETRDMAAHGIDRLSVTALVREGMTADSLRQVLDWLLYETLERSNRKERRNVRVVWAYVVEDTVSGTVDWRAMAIWSDPKLPRTLAPAGIGGDAARDGAVEHDFTNPSRRTDSTVGEESGDRILPR